MKLTVLKNETVGTIPDALTLMDGTPVTDRLTWERRRAEMAELAIGLQFGGMPPEPDFLDAEPLDDRGWGEIRGFRVTTGRRDCPVTMEVYAALPETPGKYPVIVDGDPGGTYLEGREALAKRINERGAVYAGFTKHTLAPDRVSDRNEGLYAAYPELGFSCLSAWAWGYHRTADALILLGLADEGRFVYTGHSRGGKTALLAGATDARAAIVNPAGSGCGGAGLYHVRMEALTSEGESRRNERLDDIVTRFPYWFGEGMKDYIGHDAELPFDEHFMAALVAPRFLLLNEGIDDIWASPVGTLRMIEEAKKIYAFLGAPGNLRAKWRTGGHSHSATDWEALLEAMDHVFGGQPLPAGFEEFPEF